MNFSSEQDKALLMVKRWLSNSSRPQVFRLFGYAGTGKTTLARHIADGVDGDVYFACYTGKAAHVLRQKGCRGASTIHSLIYNTREKSATALREMEADLAGLRVRNLGDSPQAKELERSILKERENLSQPSFRLNTASSIKDAKLIIIDECSMVDGKMGEDLLWFGVPVLVLGDPAQLPPVAGGGFFTETNPDIMLTEIHRQAKDNPIIEMATIVREGGRLQLGTYGESSYIRRSDVSPEMVLQSDQILVGRNKTRRASNNRYRSLLGRDAPHPVIGEKLVCLRNNHDLGLLNGSLWTATAIGDIYEDRIFMDVSAQDDDLVLDGVESHMHYFDGRDEKLAWWERKEAQEFDYGYAMTVHKGQGSQFNNVFMFDESGAFREHRARWLYTGITRAAEKITIVES